MEKVYKTMKSVGTGNIAIGIIMIVAGLSAGIVAIVGGARLIKEKSDITF